MNPGPTGITVSLPMADYPHPAATEIVWHSKRPDRKFVECHMVVERILDAAAGFRRAAAAEFQRELREMSDPDWSSEENSPGRREPEPSDEDARSGAESPGEEPGLPAALPDPTSPPCAALWAAVGLAPWPPRSEKRMRPEDVVQWVDRLDAGGAGPAIREGFRQYIAALRTVPQLALAGDPTLAQLVASGLEWVELVREDPAHLAHFTADLQEADLTWYL